MGQVVDKTVNLELVGLDGNAFSLMGAFQQQARREGWTQEEVNKVLDECKNGDYDHLLATLLEHCGVEDDNEDEEPISRKRRRKRHDQ